MRKIAYLSIWLIFYSSLAIAHPHEWIEVRVTPQTNQQGEITALQEHWTFDPYSAQMYIEPILKLDGLTKQKAAFEKFTQEVDDSLRPQKYYTYSTTPFLDAQERKLEVNKAGDLVFSFVLPLQKPRKKLAYKIYESTYFIEMRYADDQKTEWENGCHLLIQESEPDAEQYSLAADLDRGAAAPEGLGELFAQYSELTCQKTPPAN